MEVSPEIMGMLEPLNSGLNLVALHPTGSRFMCSPPVMDTDIDFVVLVQDLDAAHTTLTADGWEKCGAPQEQEEFPQPEPFTVNELWRAHVQQALQAESDSTYDELGEFVAYRRGQYNLILCEDRCFYMKYCAATLLCAKLNLLDKAERVALFASVVKGEPYLGRVA